MIILMGFFMTIIIVGIVVAVIIGVLISSLDNTAQTNKNISNAGLNKITKKNNNSTLKIELKGKIGEEIVAKELEKIIRIKKNY